MGGLQCRVPLCTKPSTSRFQYRGRSWEGCNSDSSSGARTLFAMCFNTEDGRGRAAIVFANANIFYRKEVSIPRTVVGGLQCCSDLPWQSGRNAFQYRGRSWEGCNSYTSILETTALMFQYRGRSWEGCNLPHRISSVRRSSVFQYRGRSWEGCNTVPLSPWGYWPQMSKMENLCDFPAFSFLRQQALFAFCSVTISETLALQGFAVFGKKLENLRPF